MDTDRERRLESVALLLGMDLAGSAYTLPRPRRRTHRRVQTRRSARDAARPVLGLHIYRAI